MSQYIVSYGLLGSAAFFEVFPKLRSLILREESGGVEVPARFTRHDGRVGYLQHVDVGQSGGIKKRKKKKKMIKGAPVSQDPEAFTKT